jgi:hypothetical protein
MVMRREARFDLATRFRQDGASIGELFAFMSGLYFRGKLAYSSVFSAPPDGVPGSFVITAGRGLLPPSTIISQAELTAIAEVPVELTEPRYRDALERDALRLRADAGPDCEIVLLGSIATSKYLEPLIDVFGSQLLFPSEFVGRGDMSRGGLMLRCSRDLTELEYIPAASAVRRGRRPPKLPRPGRMP